MATITIKNMPDDLFERLKQSAEAHQRSINDEIIACLDWSFPYEGKQRDTSSEMMNSPR